MPIINLTGNLVWRLTPSLLGSIDLDYTARIKSPDPTAVRGRRRRVCASAELSNLKLFFSACVNQLLIEKSTQPKERARGGVGVGWGDRTDESGAADRANTSTPGSRPVCLEMTMMETYVLFVLLSGWEHISRQGGDRPGWVMAMWEEETRYSGAKKKLFWSDTLTALSSYRQDRTCSYRHRKNPNGLILACHICQFIYCLLRHIHNDQECNRMAGYHSV